MAGQIFFIAKASSYKGDLHAGIWVLQELEVFDSAGGLAEFQFDMRTSKYFSILTSVIFERSTFKGRRHHDPRRRRGNKMDQGERNDAYNPNNRSDYFPTSEFHNAHLP